MVKICPNCNEQVRDTDIFCPFCGGSIEYDQSGAQADDSHPGVSSSDLICTNCGAVNKVGSKYCESCGFIIQHPPTYSGGGTSSAASTQSFGSQSSSRASQQAHTYGSYSTQSSDSERKWYTPPKRKRSAKHPIEWFFWTGWGIYILIRVIFWVLFFALRIFARSRGRRF